MCGSRYPVENLKNVKEQKKTRTDQCVIFRIRQKVPVQAGAGKIPGEEPDPGYQCPGTDCFYFYE